MLVSLAVIIILGMISNSIFEKFKLPGLLGMLILGITIGPHALNWIDSEVMEISADLRKFALIIILLRAGMGISTDKLKKVGGTALKLSCIPGIIEGFVIAFLSIKLLGFTFVQGGILGFIIAAVSPAVVVPQMLEFARNGIGTKKGIPTLIMAGVSIDDVFAITIFTTFMGLYSGEHVNIAMKLFNIPVSIILGIGLGFLIGLIIVKMFKKINITPTNKVLLLISMAILITGGTELIKEKLEIAGLLSVMALGFVILEKSPEVAEKMSPKLNSIWLLAKIFLFVLVGAEVNISVALDAGIKGIIIIFIGFIGRSIGVLISTKGSILNYKERLFCVIAYTPKATVQAAIGAVPLAAGVASGDVILAIAVLSILITAPLGAIAIKASAEKLLDTEDEILEEVVTGNN